MARVAPGYLFRDIMFLRPYVQDGPTGRVFGEEREVRCHWEGKVRLRSQAGRKRHVAYAKVFVPRSEMEERDYDVVTEEPVSPVRVGSRVGAVRVGEGLVPPFGFARQNHIWRRRSRPAADFHLEDRVFYGGIYYQIVSVTEYDSPRGPDHFVLKVADQRGAGI